MPELPKHNVVRPRWLCGSFKQKKTAEVDEAGAQLAHFSGKMDQGHRGRTEDDGEGA